MCGAYRSHRSAGQAGDATAAGSRDRSLADAPALHDTSTAELLLVLEVLAACASRSPSSMPAWSRADTGEAYPCSSRSISGQRAEQYRHIPMSAPLLAIRCKVIAIRCKAFDLPTTTIILARSRSDLNCHSDSGNQA